MEYYLSCRRKRPRFFLIAALFLTGILFALSSVRSTVQSAVLYRGRIALTQLLQESVLSALTPEISYSDFVKVQTDSAQRVTAVETNSVLLSRLQAQLTKEVNERLSEREACVVRLPLGTFTGSYFLAGKGPSLSFRVIPASGVTTRLCHSFESAGINQTRHSILLELSVDGLALLPGAGKPFSVETTVVLADTVIVGVTPQVYANFAAEGFS